MPVSRSDILIVCVCPDLMKMYVALMVTIRRWRLTQFV